VDVILGEQRRGGWLPELLVRWREARRADDEKNSESVDASRLTSVLRHTATLFR